MLANFGQEGWSQDRPFDPYRIALGESAKGLVAAVCGDVERYQHRVGLRQRRRRANAQKRFAATVEAVLCDLIHREATAPGGRIAIPLSKKILGYADRYASQTLNMQLPGIVKALGELGLLHLEKGYSEYAGSKVRSTVRASAALTALAGDHCVTLSDMGRNVTAEEVIVLKRAKRDYWDDGDRIDYEDTPKTRRYRAEMRAINDHLASACIEFDQEKARASCAVDLTARTLSRYFNNGSFEIGGRLFRGFWQPLGKAERKHITINGECVVEVDYGQFNPRAAYAIAGAVPPEGDQYAIPGFEEHREGLKKVFNALLSAVKPVTRFPKGARQLFARGCTVGDVVSAVEAWHRPIAHLFCTGLIGRLQHMESQILVEVLLALAEERVVALPIHDAVLVPVSGATKAREAMLRSFTRHTGHVGVVSMG